MNRFGCYCIDDDFNDMIQVGAPLVLSLNRLVGYMLDSHAIISVDLAPGFVPEAATSHGEFPAHSDRLQLSTMREAICIHIGQELWCNLSGFFPCDRFPR